MSTYCTTCKQKINEVVIIDGKPYGTTCAENKLGIRQFPSWFRGGDWNKAKIDHDAVQAQMAAEFIAAKNITANCWSEWSILSKAHKDARIRGNDWAVNFIASIVDQLGYFTILAETHHATMEDAEKLWGAASGSFPYLYQKPKSISELSPKQQALIKKFI